MVSCLTDPEDVRTTIFERRASQVVKYLGPAATWARYVFRIDVINDVDTVEGNGLQIVVVHEEQLAQAWIVKPHVAYLQDLKARKVDGCPIEDAMTIGKSNAADSEVSQAR
jgi:hypothetical protein